MLRALALRSLPALEAIGRSDLSRKRLKTASQGVDNTAAMAVYATVESNRRRLRRCSTAGRHAGTCTGPRKARPGVHATRECLTFRRPSNVVSLLRSGRPYAFV